MTTAAAAESTLDGQAHRAQAKSAHGGAEGEGFCVIQDALEGLAVRLLSQLRKLYEESKLTDVELIAGEGDDCESFAVHRVVLACASDYFRALFDGPFAEASSTSATLQVRLPDCSPQSVKAFLEFVYTGRTMVRRTDLFTMYRIARRLQCETLALEIMHLWKISMHQDNVVELLNISASCEMGEARAVLLKWADEHFAELVQLDDFTMLCPGALLTLLRSDRLLVDSEEVVLDAVVRWLLAHYGAAEPPPPPAAAVGASPPGSPPPGSPRLCSPPRAGSPRSGSPRVRIGKALSGRSAEVRPEARSEEPPPSFPEASDRRKSLEVAADGRPRQLRLGRPVSAARAFLRGLDIEEPEEVAVLKSGKDSDEGPHQAGVLMLRHVRWAQLADLAGVPRRLGVRRLPAALVREIERLVMDASSLTASRKLREGPAAGARGKAGPKRGGKATGSKKGSRQPFQNSGASASAPVPKEQAGWLRGRAYGEDGRVTGIWDPATTEPLLFLSNDHAFAPLLCLVDIPESVGASASQSLPSGAPSETSPAAARCRRGGRCLVQAFRDLHVLSLETWIMLTTLAPPRHVPDVVCSAISAVASRLVVAAFHNFLCVWRCGGSWDLVGILTLRDRVSALVYTPQIPLHCGREEYTLSGLFCGSLSGTLDLLIPEGQDVASAALGSPGAAAGQNRSAGGAGAGAASQGPGEPAQLLTFARPWGEQGASVGNDKVETMLLFGEFLLTAAEQLTVWRIEASLGGHWRRRGSAPAGISGELLVDVQGLEVRCQLAQHVVSHGMVSSLARVGPHTVAVGTERGCVMILSGRPRAAGNDEGQPFVVAFELQVFPSEITALYCQCPNELIVAGNDWNPEEGTYSVCDAVKVFNLEDDPSRGRGQVRSSLRLRAEYRDPAVDGFRSLVVAGRKLVAVVAHDEDRFSVKVYDS